MQWTPCPYLSILEPRRGDREPLASGPGGALTLAHAAGGAVDVDFVYLQPGAWGRFRGLPVRRAAGDALAASGAAFLRYGGTRAAERDAGARGNIREIGVF